MAVVIDDHHLLDHLAGRLSGWVAHEVRTSAVYTTASWYFRVANAASHGSGAGSLSGRIEALPRHQQLALRSKLGSLPDSIGLVGPRTLVPLMAALRSPRRLNYLNAEALALAVTAGASIAVRTESPLLRGACDALHVEYRVNPVR